MAIAAGGLMALVLGGCKTVEKTETIGHKGKARLNPYLAAERLLESFGHDVRSQYGWPDFEESGVATAIIPASALTAEGYVRDLAEWVRWMGHAVILLEGGEFHRGDWNGSQPPPLEPSEALVDWLEEAGLSIEPGDWSDDARSTEEVTFEGETFDVRMKSRSHPVFRGETDGPSMISAPSGEGRITLVADARPFRNRYIGDHDHAALLVDLVESTPYMGSVTFVRNASLSFWGLLWSRGWAAMVPLLLLVLFWLWKNLPRFGPLERGVPTAQPRSQSHHLTAIGGFHWRLDRGRHLLEPLRESLRERAHALMLASGRADADIFEVVAGRAGISPEAARRAMTRDHCRDSGEFARVVADLQRIHLSMP
jgi:hypothetical protein